MNIDYKKVGDYLLPNLVIENQNYGEINKYGLLRLEYIKKNKKGLYQALLMKNELTNHLFSVSNEAKERLKILMDNYIKNDEKILMLKGFLDTGNELREPITNLPCILIEDEYLLQLELKKEDEYFIRYKTIDSSDILHGFRSDFIKIKGKDDSAWREIDAIVCGCKTTLSKENDYQVLLSRGII